MAGRTLRSAIKLTKGDWSWKGVNEVLLIHGIPWPGQPAGKAQIKNDTDDTTFIFDVIPVGSTFGEWKKETPFKVILAPGDRIGVHASTGLFADDLVVFRWRTQPVQDGDDAASGGKPPSVIDDAFDWIEANLWTVVALIVAALLIIFALPALIGKI